MVEALLAIVDPRWQPYLEVPVHRPVRGVIDIVLGERETALLVAIEAHSDLRRLEQQVRWAADKSEALANTELARFASEAGTREPAISRLMLLRSSRHTRELARTFERTLAAAYPARPADVFAALTRPDDPWPGAGMLWATLDGTEAHVLASAPRGVRLGR